MTADGRHMDKVKEETPDERGNALRLAAIHGDVTWRSIRIISTILTSYTAGSFLFILEQAKSGDTLTIDVPLQSRDNIL
ncbi:hypothetical protein Y032_0097g3021 [Ancylostoma ceylanicum]|uniref:Uncharacterized protein n=1 Tax=Ancylostoma ceylanicum TaxID=53326 RepID=A0A016TJU6_9BILA|nr:hypothetical protein Y032_0097g3021 [Ancylostoma ceylanicum]